MITVRWRGGDLDRLVDRRHASLAATVVLRLEPLGWTLVPEVSYSEFGERGSIDLLAWHVATRILLVIEVKTELTSIEATLRRHDAKVRLGGRIAADRFGWVPEHVARLLVLPEERTPRRHVQLHDVVLRRAYPDRGGEIRTWLAAPAGRIWGLMFLSDADVARRKQRVGATRRVRQANRARMTAGGTADPRVLGS